MNKEQLIEKLYKEGHITFKEAILLAEESKPEATPQVNWDPWYIPYNPDPLYPLRPYWMVQPYLWPYTGTPYVQQPGSISVYDDGHITTSIQVSSGCPTISQSGTSSTSIYNLNPSNYKENLYIRKECGL